MSIAQVFVAELEQEAKTTRRFLEQLPEDKLGWTPHPKSMTAGQLALHIAQIPGAIVKMGANDEAPVPDFTKPFPTPASKQEVLKTFDQSIADARTGLSQVTDERMQTIFKLKAGDKVAMALPQVGLYRAVLLNHWYHHRGQFGVYLRLLGAKVPSSYGPSGDEMPAM